MNRPKSLEFVNLGINFTNISPTYTNYFNNNFIKHLSQAKPYKLKLILSLIAINSKFSFEIPNDHPTRLYITQ